MKHQCEFCNEPATAGTSGPARQHFWCQACAERFGRVLQTVYSESSKPADPKASLRWIESSMEEATRRMRSQLSKGGSDG
jgi:hypothetical protein